MFLAVQWSDTYVANGEIISDWTTADQTNHTYDAHYLIGNYYSWMDATAGTGYGLTNGNASGSICPKNWHLPSQDDFSALIADLPQTIYPAISLPIALTMGGRIMDDRDAMEGFGSIVIYGANGRGGFWSSEASPNDIIAPPFLSIVTGPAVISGNNSLVVGLTPFAASLGRMIQIKIAETVASRHSLGLLYYPTLSSSVTVCPLVITIWSSSTVLTVKVSVSANR